MKSKKQMVKSEMVEHGTKKKFAAIKKAKNPKALALLIVKQHQQSKKKKAK